MGLFRKSQFALQRYGLFLMPPNKITNIFQLFFILQRMAHSIAMWTADYCSEYPLQINRIWKNGSEVGKRKRDNVITWECKADLNPTQTPANLIQVTLRQQFTTTKSIKPTSLPPACNKSHIHEANTKYSPLPSSYQKTGEKRRDSKRKCVTLWGRLTASTS